MCVSDEDDEFEVVDVFVCQTFENCNETLSLSLSHTHTLTYSRIIRIYFRGLEHADPSDRAFIDYN